MHTIYLSVAVMTSVESGTIALMSVVVSSYDIAEDIGHLSDVSCEDPGDETVGSADGAIKSDWAMHG